jgi:hypothetical protein
MRLVAADQERVERAEQMVAGCCWKMQMQSLRTMDS